MAVIGQVFLQRILFSMCKALRHKQIYLLTLLSIFISRLKCKNGSRIDRIRLADFTMRLRNAIYVEIKIRTIF